MGLSVRLSADSFVNLRLACQDVAAKESGADDFSSDGMPANATEQQPTCHLAETLDGDKEPQKGEEGEVRAMARMPSGCGLRQG